MLINGFSITEISKDLSIYFFKFNFLVLKKIKVIYQFLSKLIGIINLHHQLIFQFFAQYKF